MQLASFSAHRRRIDLAIFLIGRWGPSEARTSMSSCVGSTGTSWASYGLALLSKLVYGTSLKSETMVSSPGSLCDPGLGSDIGVNPDSVIDLRTITSIFNGDPRIYNRISYLVSGSLILLWSVAVWKSKPSPLKDRFAPASIAALSMLLGYHRQHDASCSCLRFRPSVCSRLKKGLIGWIALALTGGAVILDGDITSVGRA